MVSYRLRGNGFGSRESRFRGKIGSTYRGLVNPDHAQREFRLRFVFQGDRVRYRRAKIRSLYGDVYTRARIHGIHGFRVELLARPRERSPAPSPASSCHHRHPQCRNWHPAKILHMQPLRSLARCLVNRGYSGFSPRVFIAGIFDGPSIRELDDY